jgi:cytochrome P450
MLRWTSPVTMFARTATRDTEVGGVALASGERVVMFYPSANRDEAHFTDPERFDVGRSPNPHLAFGGGGTHFCLGASLARVEACAIFSELITRTESIEIIGPVERVRSVLINGVRSMPVRLTPAAG